MHPTIPAFHAARLSECGDDPSQVSRSPCGAHLRGVDVLPYYVFGIGMATLHFLRGHNFRP